MKFTIYKNKINNQCCFDIYSSFIEENNFKDGQIIKTKIEEFIFPSQIYIRRFISKKPKPCQIGRISIPKNISDYLKLKNKQKIEVEFLK